MKKTLLLALAALALVSSSALAVGLNIKQAADGTYYNVLNFFRTDSSGVPLHFTIPPLAGSSVRWANSWTNSGVTAYKDTTTIKGGSAVADGYLSAGRPDTTEAVSTFLWSHSGALSAPSTASIAMGRVTLRFQGPHTYAPGDSIGYIIQTSPDGLNWTKNVTHTWLTGLTAADSLVTFSVPSDADLSTVTPYLWPYFRIIVSPDVSSAGQLTGAECKVFYFKSISY